MKDTIKRNLICWLTKHTWTMSVHSMMLCKRCGGVAEDFPLSAKRWIDIPEDKS